MPATMAIRSKAGATLAAAAIAVALLGGCTGRDTQLAEQTAAAEQQAVRAEKAADRAESAAKTVERVVAQPAAADAEETETPVDPDSTTVTSEDGPRDPTPTASAKATS